MRKTPPSSSGLTRRRFLQNATATAIAAASAPRYASGQVASSDRLGMAVIGCGGIARAHGPSLTAPFEVRVVCEVDRLRGEAFVREFANGAASTDDYREAVHRTDVDAVLICTPDHWHAAIAEEAMDAGKDVYCEKPLTLTIEEGVRLREVAGKSGRILQVGTQQRSDPAFQTAVAAIREGRLGQLKRVVTAIGGGPVGGPFATTPVPPELDWDRWLGATPHVDYRPERCHGNFRWWYEYSGGKMTDWGAHHVDIALWGIDFQPQGGLVIDPTEVVHSPALIDGMPSTDDCYNTAQTFKVRCTLANDVELQIRDDALDLGFENGILFEGDEGRVFVNRGKLTGRPIEELADNPLPEESLADLRKGRAIATHLAAFYQACRDRGEPISDVDSHVRHLNVCHAANIAMRLGKTVTWRPEEDAFADSELNRWRSRKAAN